MPADTREKLRKDPLFAIGFSLALLWVLAAMLGPMLAPFDPWEMSFTPFSSPSNAHLMGINDGGQDAFSGFLYAVRNSLIFGCITGLTALFLGVLIGAVCALYRGWFDLIVMRMADVLLSIPLIMVLIFVAALFRPPPLVLALLLGGLTWPTIARTIRAQALTVRQRLYVKAAYQIGGGTFYVLRRHLIPELFPLFLIGFAAKARMAVFMEASLAFLGLMDPSHKSLGIMINRAMQYYYLDVWWNLLLPPVLCLSLFIISVTFLAVSMERVFDPRLRLRI